MSHFQAHSIWNRLPSAFSSLKHRNYRYFWFNESISLIGMWMQVIAHGWLVYNLTGSRFLLGVINTVSGLPILFLSPFGGIIADKYNKKDILIFTQIVFTILSFLVGYLIYIHKINFPILLIIGLLFGIANAIDSPTRQAFVVELVGPQYLANAIALNSLAFNTARMLGPAIAGYVIAYFGIELCYFANAITFLGVIWALIYLKGDFKPKFENKQSTKLALKEGLKYIFYNKSILSYLILISFTSIFAMQYAVLMPVYAKDIFQKGPQALGTLMAASGFGALIGALMLASYNKNFNLKKLVYFSTFTMSLATFIFAFSKIFYLSMLMLAILGWSIVSQAATINTLIQNETPHNLRGRIMSFYVIAFMGLMPVGSFIAGSLAQIFGAQFALGLGAIFVFLALVFIFLKEYQVQNFKKS